MKSLAKYLNIYQFNRSQRIHFFINVSVGVVIALLFVLMGKFDWGEQVINQGFDILVRLESRIYTEKSAPAKSPVCFIDITDDDHKRWGRPEMTPRGKVAQMVEDAWKQGAAVVFVDVLMPRENRDDPTGDRELHVLFERMLREDANTHVILPVTVNHDGSIGSHFLDKLLNRTTTSDKQIFHRGYPAIEASASDRLNRYWAPYQPYLNNRGDPCVLWSVTLLASAIREEKLDALNRLGHELEQAAHQSRTGSHASRSISLGERQVEIPAFRIITDTNNNITVERDETHSAPYTQRIRYRIAPDTQSTARLRLTADKFSPGDINPLPDLKGKVVLIGNTSHDMGDYHWTPVGLLPGVYILGNAINTLAAGLQPIHMNSFLHFLIELFVILVAASFFLYFTKLLAQVLACTLFVILFFPLSWLAYDIWGIFFNFVVPLIGMSFQRTVSGMEDIIIHRGIKKRYS
ncbi:MAG: CHASE2 domain-containing protein [Syntrophus sp. (in: bacteria)]